MSKFKKCSGGSGGSAMISSWFGSSGGCGELTKEVRLAVSMVVENTVRAVVQVEHIRLTLG